MIGRTAIGVALVAVFSLVPLWVVQQQASAAEQGIVPATAGTGASPPSSEENEQITIPPAAGNSPAKPVQEEVLMARVGDQKITADDFMKYISQDGQLVKMSTTNQGKAQVLREMILDRLIEGGMRREGFLPKDRSPTQPDYLRGYSLLAAKYFPEANQTPDEEKIHQYYMDHQEAFGIPAMVRIGQIQFRVPANASSKDAEAIKARADDTLRRLRAGESFAALAKVLTDNPQGKVAEGDLGFLPVNQDPWLRDAIAGLAVGQYSEVLKSPVGYEIILLVEKRDALTAPYANVRGKVIASMRQEAHRKGREAYAWRLAKEVGVTVEIDELKGAIP